MRAGVVVVVALLAGCATAVLQSDDPRRAVVLAPYLRVIPPFGQVHIPEGTVLYPATVDGQPSWCSTAPVYFVPGEARPLCLFDPSGGSQTEGWFKTAYVAGSLASLRYDVDVPYRVGQRPALPARQ